MNRREFLLFRTDERRRVLELSCERLYMHYLDTETASDVQLPFADDAYWGGEPPAVFERRTSAELFADLERDLRAVDVLRIADCEWLGAAPFGERLESIVDRFRARGGTVELIGRSQPAQHA